MRERDIGCLICTFIRADSEPVGIGRSEPNHSPHCPEPSGRFKWTINPWELFVK